MIVIGEGGKKGDVVLEALHWYIMRATPCFAKRGGAKKEALGVFLCRDVGICNSKELRNEKRRWLCLFERDYSFWSVLKRMNMNI